MAWHDFKEFTHSAAHSAIVHALVLLQPHYPLVRPELIMTGYARETSVAKITKLEDEVEDVAGKLTEDVNLFGEEQNNT